MYFINNFQWTAGVRGGERGKAGETASSRGADQPQPAAGGQHHLQALHRLPP